MKRILPAVVLAIGMLTLIVAPCAFASSQPDGQPASSTFSGGVGEYSTYVHEKYKPDTYVTTGYWDKGSWTPVMNKTSDNSEEHDIDFVSGNHGTIGDSSWKGNIGKSIKFPFLDADDGFLFLG